MSESQGKTLEYLVLGSGLASLTFSALMAKKGHSVTTLESHEFFGGYGHTFQEGEYKFNAHLHYVVGCGEDGVVTTILKKLNLDKTVLFTKLDPVSYDRVFCDGQLFKLPYTLEKLQENMIAYDPSPESKQAIFKFIHVLKLFNKVSQRFPRHFRHSYKLLPVLPSLFPLLKYKNATLQYFFDDCKLPALLQTFLAGQLLNYLSPPKKLSFFVWAALFMGYNKAAYYPIKHFEHVINALIETIQKYQGKLFNNIKVVEFIKENNSNNTIIGVKTQAVDPKTGIAFGPKQALYAKNIICNFDPKQAAEMIGIDSFSKTLKKQLDYDYCGSSFVLYAVVKGIDLREFGFGSWNIWHCQNDLNKTFDLMHNEQDYSQPYFAMNSCSLHYGVDNSNCSKENHQIFQMLTVANYDYWANLKIRDRHTYNKKKTELFDQLLDIVEKNYVPNIRKHIVFKMTGTPTTNERYVLAPKGGCYGVNLTPRNFQFSRKLGSDTSIKNFYFCCAASGCGGFTGAMMTGLSLYEKLSNDYLE